MCDTMVALGSVTADGATLFAKNSDREPNEAHELLRIPAARHAAGERVQCTYIEIPQVEETYQVLLCKPFWIWGTEMGANEHGVTIGNEAVYSKVPYGKKPGLIGMDFQRLALERSRTASQALQVITNLLGVYDQGGNCGLRHKSYYHNSYIIADPNKRGYWKPLVNTGRQSRCEISVRSRTGSRLAVLSIWHRRTLSRSPSTRAGARGATIFISRAAIPIRSTLA